MQRTAVNPWNWSVGLGFDQAQLVENRRRELILMLDGIVIAADKGQSHARVIAERRFKQLARSDCAVANLQSFAGVLFCTNPAEKLIQIM